MLTVYITRGLPASGKSTWAVEKLKTNLGGIKRVNKDLLREMLDGSHWSKGNEKFILQIRDDIIYRALGSGKHVIVDDTNLDPKHIPQIEKVVAEARDNFKTEVKVEIVDFTDVGVDECIKRDSQRHNYVGEKVIREMYTRYLKDKEYKQPKVAEQDPSLPHAIICDLDGTLALLNGRNPYDASTCENDLVNEPVLSVINSYWQGAKVKGGLLDKYVIFVSGRSDQYREQTVSFLEEIGWHEASLFMRKEGDTRKDSIVKKEILDNEIKGKFYVDFILDDRLSVCQMWRQEGYTVFQVAEGSF